MTTANTRHSKTHCSYKEVPTVETIPSQIPKQAVVLSQNHVLCSKARSRTFTREKAVRSLACLTMLLIEANPPPACQRCSTARRRPGRSPPPPARRRPWQSPVSDCCRACRGTACLIPSSPGPAFLPGAQDGSTNVEAGTVQALARASNRGKAGHPLKTSVARPPAHACKFTCDFWRSDGIRQPHRCTAAGG